MELKLYSTTSSKLDTLDVVGGQVIVSQDNSCLYIDIDSIGRLQITDWIELATENERLSVLAPIPHKVYYILETNTIWKQIDGNWRCLNMAINDQSPTYNINSTISTLVSGEKISVAFGKIAKAIADLISHIANKANPHGVTAAQIGAATSDHTHDGYAESGHTHSGYASSGHTHDDRYYTESEINTKLNGKADTGHTHTPAQAGVTTAWLDQNHVHDKQNIKPSAIELTPTGIGVNNGGYIDFHFNQSTADYTSRIIESASGKLNISGSLNIGGTITEGGKDVWSANNKPMGTYTGNGNAAARTIAIGGKGSLLLLYYSSYVVFVGSGGGMYFNFYDGSSGKFTSSEVKFSGGNMTIASTSQFLNQNGRVIGWLLL